MHVLMIRNEIHVNREWHSDRHNDTAVSATAVQHNGKFSTSGIGSTAGHSRVGDNGEATASTGRSASNLRAVTAATNGGVGNSSTSHSHAAN